MLNMEELSAMGFLPLLHTYSYAVFVIFYANKVPREGRQPTFSMYTVG